MGIRSSLLTFNFKYDKLKDSGKNEDGRIFHKLQYPGVKMICWIVHGRSSGTWKDYGWGEPLITCG